MTTPWLDFLTRHGGRVEGDRVQDFGAPEHERTLAASGSVVSDLSQFAVLYFSGDDAREFLQGQVSCDVKNLPADRSVYGAYCTPKGRMLASFLLWQVPDGFAMLLSRSIAAAIHKRLQMFVLRSKVKIADVNAQQVVLGASGPQAAQALAGVGAAVPSTTHGVARSDNTTLLRVPGERLLAVTAANEAPRAWEALSSALAPVGSPCWDWFEIVNGIPWITTATQDQFVPQMVNLEAIGGVNFQKGCYPGQEIVARTQYLGKSKRRMVLAHVETDVASNVAAGNAVYSEDLGDQASGMIVNAAPAPHGGSDVLAVLHATSAATSVAHVGALQGPVLAVRALPYMVE